MAHLFNEDSSDVTYSQIDNFKTCPEDLKKNMEELIQVEEESQFQQPEKQEKMSKEEDKAMEVDNSLNVKKSCCNPTGKQC